MKHTEQPRAEEPRSRLVWFTMTSLLAVTITLLLTLGGGDVSAGEPVDPGVGGKKIILPFAIYRAQLSQDGLHYFCSGSTGQIAVIDIASCKLRGTLKAPGRDLMMVGTGKRLIAYCRTTRTYTSYDITEMKMIKQRELKLAKGETVNSLIMGGAKSTNALATRATRGNPKTSFDLVHLPTLKTLSLKFNPGKLEAQSGTWDKIVASNSSLGIVVVSRGGHGHYIATVSAKEGVRVRAISKTDLLNRPVFFSSDGKSLYYGRGIRAALSLKPALDHSKRGCKFIPVVGTNRYVVSGKDQETGSTGFRFREHRTDRSVFFASRQERPEFAHGGEFSGTLDRYIAKAGGTVSIYRLGIDGKDAKGGAVREKTTCFPGKRWRYTLTYPEGTKIKLEDVPRGTELRGKELVWTAPDKIEPQIIEFFISIAKPGEDEIWRTISLTIPRPQK